MTATVQARAVFGPPRPVLVVSVAGEIDSANQREFDRVLGEVAAQRGTTHFRRQFGCQEVATMLVVDLREATFVGVRALFCLADRRDDNGRPPRLVVDANSVVRRALAASGLDDTFEIFTDLADAVLAEAQPRDRD